MSFGNTTGGFSNSSPGGGNGAHLDNAVLLRRILALEDQLRQNRPQSVVIVTGSATGGVHPGQVFSSKISVGSGGLYYGMIPTPGAVSIVNTFKNGTWGTNIPIGAVMNASHRKSVEGDDVYIVQYVQPGGTNGLGIGGGGGGVPPGGGGGSGDPDDPTDPGGGGGGGSDTLKLYYLSNYSPGEPVGWNDPILIPLSRCTAPGVSGDARAPACDTWYAIVDSCDAIYAQDTGLPCSTPPEDYPPPPDAPDIAPDAACT